MVGCERMGIRGRSLMSVAPVAIVVYALSAVAAGQTGFRSGQDITPAFDGWEENSDGTFNLVFGYFNRNWDEELDIPIGPGNSLEPGAPDQGQPTHFFPRRNRYVFRVKVPKDFGNKELTWTLTASGKTNK